MHNFKELKVWQKSRELVKSIYSIQVPKEELYGLGSQMRRASVSISSNIAEGSSRKSTKDFVRFLNMSLGSAYELETQIILCYDLELIKKNQFDIISTELTEVQKMLHGLIKFQNKTNQETTLNS